MRHLVAALAFSALLSGCAMLAERAPGYAANALDSTANRTTDVALDKAEDKARSAGSGSSSEPEKKEEGPAVSRKVDSDDVLIKDGNDYVVGKQMGAQVLIVKTGQRVDAAGRDVVPVRPAKKSDCKVGQDVFFTTAHGDVRRASWTVGPVTDDAAAGEGKCAVGPETGILWDGQVAVRR